MPVNNIGVTPGFVKATAAALEGKLGGKVGGTPKSGQLDNPLGGAPKSAAAGQPPRLASLNTLKSVADTALKFSGLPGSPLAPPLPAAHHGQSALSAEDHHQLKQMQQDMRASQQMNTAIQKLKTEGERHQASLTLQNDIQENISKRISKAASGLKDL